MAGTTPDVSTLTKVWYATTLTGDKTQVSFTTEIPELESVPDAITASVLDLDYELAQPGIRKAETIEIPVLYTHTQHKRLKQLNPDTEYYWFFQLPDATAETTGKPLVRYFTGKIRIGLDTISPEEFIKDKVTLYKTSAVSESDGFPSASL